MRVRSLMPLSFVMLMTCSPARMRPPAAPAAAPTPVSQVTSPPTVNPLLPPSRLTHFSSLRAAVASILRRDTQVVAFGEIHKDRASNLISTLQRFAREVMPLLAEQGITDLVLEHLPSGATSAREVAIFNRTGRLGPFLRDWFAYHPDYCGVIETLRQANTLGIALHGTHASSVREYRANLLGMQYLINQRTLEATRTLLGEGHRVAVYSGAKHNNIVPYDQDSGTNFGQVLHHELGARYVEIDFYLPELADTFPVQSALTLANWSAMVPTSGINLFSSTGDRYVLLSSRQPTAVVPFIPEFAPNCP